MDRPARGAKPVKARIPDHLRRRALVSCDRCKKRRIRCLRPAGSSNDTHGQEPCQSCLEAGANCESTLPRKTRIYGSVETLSLRYRVLDALIRGLYPYKDTSSLDTLYSIAEANDITLPEFKDNAVAEEAFSQSPKQADRPGPFVDPAEVVSTQLDRSIQAESPAAKLVEEKLVPTPHGPSHYIGPSSSFGFVLTVRNMVAEFNAALREIQPDDERVKISSDFAGSNWSKALETKIKDESDEGAEDDLGVGSAGVGLPLDQRLNVAPWYVGSEGGAVFPTHRSRKASLSSVLPSREVTDSLIETFFDEVHPNYLLFHRNTFQIRYDSMWAESNMPVRDIPPGWICSVFMMLVFGAQALEHHDKDRSTHTQHHYLDLVQSRLHLLISATTLDNVQALLLLQLYQHNCSERNSAFMLLGCASRMAMALGMHREGTSGGFDSLERELRKRVWWTTYIFEQNQCAILGRPCAIDDAEVNVSFPDEIMLDGGASVPPGYIEYTVRLARLMSEIRRKIYASPGNPTQQAECPKVSIATQLLLDLDSWQHSLPPGLQLEYGHLLPKHRRAVHLLHIQFHHTQALVARPFILRKVSVQLAQNLGKPTGSQDLSNEEMALSHACGLFSKKAAILLHELLMIGMFDGVAWQDAYYIYHSVFILSLDFLARPLGDQDTAEDSDRKKAIRDVMFALQNVRLCPTFTVLTQVSLQLAKIVGIFDARTNGTEEAASSDEFRQYMALQPVQQVSANSDFTSEVSQGGVENMVNHWLQKDPGDLRWDLKDLFGMESYIGSSSMGFSGLPLAMGGTYGNDLPETVDDDELSTALPESNAYSHWGSMDAQFSQSQGFNRGNHERGGDIDR